MDRYLKAHDDLQTVLSLYESVLEGDTDLPLKRTDIVTNKKGRGDTGSGGASGVVDSSEDESLDGDASHGPNDTKSRGAVVAKGGSEGNSANSSGRASPQKGNLLDLEENQPLAMDDLRAGLASANFGNSFRAHQGGPTAVGAGEGVLNSSSTVASNFPSETGATYGSNTLASGSDWSAFGGQRQPLRSADSGSGFGEQRRWCWRAFSSALLRESSD